MSDGPETLSPLKRAIVEIRDLKARLAAVERREREPIALVGMGLRFPGGAHDPESFWELLWDGVDAIGEVPPARWSIDALYDADPDVPGHMATRHGGFLPDVDRFDAPFFGISPREAASMDPQQRLLLEVTWEALEHAGIAADRLAGSQTGVFVGMSNSDYFRMLLAERDQIDTFTTTGNTSSVAAGRLSYVLGLEGPSIALDTACSSSLVAVHLAAQSLRRGECDLALAGGVGLILAPELTINFSRARMMAADGRCKTFDAGADGYVRSEGCGVVVLKRLSDAIAAGDRVLALVRGSAVNQDGRSGGLTAPNGPAQERVIAAALADAEVAPGAIGYVEAHGTGTPLGDPIEVRALGAALCAGRDPGSPLLLGSVKTNVGHLEAAAGVASLIKVVLMLEHGAVPPHLHLHDLNPHIAAEHLPIAVPTTRTPWPDQPGGRVAGVSSFGLSGTNAHVVVGAAPTPAEGPGSEPGGIPQHLLPLSARSADGLVAVAARYVELLTDRSDQSWADVAAGAATGRAHLDHRLAVVAPDAETAVAKLARFGAGDPTGVVSRDGPAVTAPDVAFVFTGHGSQHAGMGHDLYAHSPVFAAAIDRCDALLGDQLDHQLPEILFGDAGLLDEMRYAQPALLAFQHALVELWRSWGVRPAVVAGHSAGEYAAAVVAGTLSLEDGLRLVTARGRLMQTLPDDGEMVAIFLDEESVAPAVGRWSADVGIAAVNGPTTTVVSGRRHAVDAVLAELDLGDGDFRRLDVSVAAHSPLVDPILDEFERAVGEARLAPPRLGLVSSMTGAVVGAELTDPGYWRRHLRRPVRFGAVFDTLRDAGYTAFVEIGPHPTLTALGQRSWPDDTPTWAPSMRRPGDGVDEWTQVLTSLGALHVAGVAVDWGGVTAGAGHPHVDLPTYPWQRQSYWAATADAGGARPPDAPRWPAAVAAATEQSGLVPLDLRVETYADRWSLLDAVATAAIAETLRALGMFTRAGEQHAVDELVDDGRVPATYAHLVGRWLGHLADDGLLTRAPDGAFRADAPLRASDLGALLTRADEAFDDVPALTDYVRLCVTSLPAIVAGEDTALSTLFPDGSYDTVDFLYHRWAIARYFNGIAAAAVAAVAAARPGGHLQVLEVGAGTGGTTAAVVPALPAGRTSYTFTDVSDFFLTRAGERFADVPFVGYGLLDLEQDPGPQGYRPGGYDVVVAANVLHATTNLDVTLGRVRDLLAPGGVLVAYEATSHPRWFDVTTGLIEGWQRFDDDWRDDQPLIAPAQWSAALTAAGFTEVLTLPGPDQATTVLGQHIVLARAPGEDGPPSDQPADRSVAVVGTGRSGRAELVELPAPAAIAEALADALPGERIDVLVDVVRRAIGRVLRIPDPSGLRRDQPLLDLGFDSLMAVELRNLLRVSLSIERKLPATLVFDHPNIAAIARYLDGLLTASAADPTSAAAAPIAVAPAAPGPPAVGAEALATMSDDEVEAMLLQKLAGFQDAP